MVWNDHKMLYIVPNDHQLIQSISLYYISSDCKEVCNPIIKLQNRVHCFWWKSRRFLIWHSFAISFYRLQLLVESFMFTNHFIVTILNNIKITPVQRKAYVVRRALYLIHNSKQTFKTKNQLFFHHFNQDLIIPDKVSMWPNQNNTAPYRG